LRELGRVDFRGSVDFEFLLWFGAFLALLSHFAWLCHFSSLLHTFVFFLLLNDILELFIGFFVF
jgi:hypothetical protein